MRNEIIYPSVEVMNVHLDPYNDMHAEDYDFFVTFSTKGNVRKQVVHKKDMTRMDADNYQALCDTSKIGRGQFEAVATCFIPDERMENLVRPTCVDLMENMEPITIV